MDPPKTPPAPMVFRLPIRPAPPRETARSQLGATAPPSKYNVYSLTFPSPAQTYYLNFDEHAGESHYVFPIDIRAVVPIEAGAKVTLASFDLDCVLVRNCMDVKVQPCKPYVIAG